MIKRYIEVIGDRIEEDDGCYALHTDHLAAIAELEGENARPRDRAMTDEQVLFLEEMVCDESPTRHDVLEGIFDIVQKEYPRVSAELVKLREEVAAFREGMPDSSALIFAAGALEDVSIYGGWLSAAKWL